MFPVSVATETCWGTRTPDTSSLPKSLLMSPIPTNKAALVKAAQLHLKTRAQRHTNHTQHHKRSHGDAQTQSHTQSLTHTHTQSSVYEQWLPSAPTAKGSD